MIETTWEQDEIDQEDLEETGTSPPDEDEDGDTMTEPATVTVLRPFAEEGLEGPDLERLQLHERLEPNQAVELWANEKKLDPTVLQLEDVRVLHYAYGTLQAFKRALRQRVGI
jgi:hypothetical protein